MTPEDLHQAGSDAAEMGLWDLAAINWAMEADMTKEDGTKTIMVHAFYTLDANNEITTDPSKVVAEEHADDWRDATGWNVWVRMETPNDPKEPFISVEEYDKDFPTMEEAMEYAKSLREVLDPYTDIEQY